MPFCISLYGKDYFMSEAKTPVKGNLNVTRLVLAAFFLSLAIILPFITGQIPEIGNMLCPMHIPVMLCGFICGGPWGAAVGLIAPLLRHLMFGMPQAPACWGMAVELAVYGVSCGVLYKLLPKKIPYIYVSLIVSMLLGRIAWGLTWALVITKIFTVPFDFTLGYFFVNGFLQAIPGIAVQLVLIPAVVIALRKQKLMMR